MRRGKRQRHMGKRKRKGDLKRVLNTFILFVAEGWSCESSGRIAIDMHRAELRPEKEAQTVTRKKPRIDTRRKGTESDRHGLFKDSSCQKNSKTGRQITGSQHQVADSTSFDACFEDGERETTVRRTGNELSEGERCT